jgi:hypothetical protein
MVVFSGYGEAKNYETLTGLDPAKGFTAANLYTPDIQGKKGLPCKAALITVETNSVNITLDGTVPTHTAGTNIGHLLTAGQSMIIMGWENVRQFLAIDAANGSGGVIKCTFFF